MTTVWLKRRKLLYGFFKPISGMGAVEIILTAFGTGCWREQFSLLVILIE
jgi:hypothetical protein